MKSSAPSSMLSRQMIINVLQDHGPLTMREIAAELQIDIDRVRCFIGSIRQKKDVIYIHSWRRDTDGGRLYPRALWAVGNLPDAPKPKKLGHLEYNRRARERRKTLVASVFHIHLKHENKQSRLSLSKTFQTPDLHLGQG